MKALGDIVRENIKGLQAYSCARAEFEGTDVTLLDANENPFASEYNRYPDPFQRELKREIGRLKGVEVSRLVLGNGSDELIDMLIRTVCTPRRDNIIVFSPGYSMYEVSGRVNDVEVRCLELDEEFQPGWNMLLDSVDQFTKMIFFCTPNNPVGNVIPLERIRVYRFYRYAVGCYFAEDLSECGRVTNSVQGLGTCRVTGRDLRGGPGTGDLFE